VHAVKQRRRADDGVDGDEALVINYEAVEPVRSAGRNEVGQDDRADEHDVDDKRVDRRPRLRAEADGPYKAVDQYDQIKREEQKHEHVDRSHERRYYEK